MAWFVRPLLLKCQQASLKFWKNQESQKFSKGVYEFAGQQLVTLLSDISPRDSGETATRATITYFMVNKQRIFLLYYYEKEVRVLRVSSALLQMHKRSSKRASYYFWFRFCPVKYFCLNLTHSVKQVVTVTNLLATAKSTTARRVARLADIDIGGLCNNN